MPRRALAPVAFVTAVVVVGWLVTGVAAIDIARFLAYDIAFVALPGVAVLWAVRGQSSSALVTIALGWPLGQALEILAFSGTAAIGQRGLYLLYPVVVILPSAYAIWRRRKAVRRDAVEERLSVAAMWTAAGALALGLIYLTLMFLPQAPLPGATVPLEYSDYPYFITLSAQVMNHWPPTTPGLVGVPLSYEWFVLFHIAAASQVTHIAIPIVGLRLDYVPTVLVVGCQLLAVGRYLTRSSWNGVVAIVIVFLLGPLDLTGRMSGSPDNVLVHFWDSWTFPFGLMFLLALLYLIIERLRAETWHDRSDIGSWVLVALVMVGASGAKATILPVVIVGAGLYFVLKLFRRRASVPAAVTAILAAAIFVSTYILVYGGETPETTIGPLVWLGRSAPVMAAELIAQPGVRAIILPLAYAAGFVGFMLPLAGMLYLLRRRHRHEISRFALPLCMLAAGILIGSVAHHAAYSELYFIDTGYVAGCFVGAEGLRLAWIDLGHSLPFSRRQIAVALAAWLAVLAIVVRNSATTIATPQSTVVLDAGVSAVGLIFVISSAAVSRARRQSASGVLALGLIPVLAASALTSPLLIYPTVRKALDHEPIMSTTMVLSPGLLTALHWLHDHSSVDSVFAVNNHWIDAARTNGKFYYYTAFSDRQAFIEAYYPYPIPPGAATPAGANFVYRQRINDAVFDRADAAALAIMTHDYGVRFLFMDRTIGPHDPSVLLLGRVVFSNQDAVIIAVG